MRTVLIWQSGHFKYTAWNRAYIYIAPCLSPLTVDSVNHYRLKLCYTSLCKDISKVLVIMKYTLKHCILIIPPARVHSSVALAIQRKKNHINVSVFVYASFQFV